MRKRLPGLFLAALVFVVTGLGGFAAETGGITTHVPFRIDQIGDPVLRDALTQYKPEYDALSHQGKVAAYVNIHQALHNGKTPPLTPDDERMLAASRQPVIPPAPAQRYEPWHDPNWHPLEGMFGIFGPFARD